MLDESELVSGRTKANSDDKDAKDPQSSKRSKVVERHDTSRSEGSHRLDVPSLSQLYLYFHGKS